MRMQKSCTALCRCRPFRTSGPRRRSRVTSRRSPASARRCCFRRPSIRWARGGRICRSRFGGRPLIRSSPVSRVRARRNFATQYEEVTKKQWTQALGFRHALFEVAIDVFKRAQNPESAASVIEAVRTTKLNTIVGPIQWQGPPPNQWTNIPVKNVCTTPMVGGQWVPGKKWMYDLVVTDNRRYPLIPVQRKMVPLPG